MAESIDVNSKSVDYISFFQSKNSPIEFKIAEKDSKNKGEQDVIAKNQEENSSENNLIKTAEDSENNSVYGTKKDNNVVEFGQRNKIQKAISYGSKSSDTENVLLQGDATYSIMSSYGALAAAVCANSRGITKMDLITYLQKISSGVKGSADDKVIAFLKNLIAQFDSLSEGGEYITSLSGAKEPQDYSTVTKEQVTSPIDLRV